MFLPVKDLSLQLKLEHFLTKKIYNISFMLWIFRQYTHSTYMEIISFQWSFHMTLKIFAKIEKFPLFFSYKVSISCTFSHGFVRMWGKWRFSYIVYIQHNSLNCKFFRGFPRKWDWRLSHIPYIYYCFSPVCTLMCPWKRCVIYEGFPTFLTFSFCLVWVLSCIWI